jgi:hypothetical protein
MFFQFATEETLVPPNLSTTHGDAPRDSSGDTLDDASGEAPDAASAIVM